MNKLVFFSNIIVFLLISLKALSFSSSSYLIANSAMSFFDYEQANIQYKNNNFSYLNYIDLQKKLLAFVNSNALDEATNVAEEVLLNDKFNQEAWLVKLVHAKCCFMTDNEKWELQYEWLEEYLELNNNNLPEKQTQYPEGNFLGTWWNIQKRLIKTNTIPQEHKNALNKLIKNSLPNR